MAKTYKGAAALTLVNTTANQIAYVYADAPAPSNVDPAELKRLVKDGYLVEVGSDEPVDASSGGQGGGPVDTSTGK